MSTPRGFAYLPVGRREISRELYVTSIGRTSYPVGARYPVDGHPKDYSFDWSGGRTLADFALVLVEQGRGEFESQSGGRVIWNAEEALFLPPGVWHRYRPSRSTGWTERWLCLNGDFLSRLRAKRHLPTQPLLRRVVDLPALLAAWSRLMHAAHANSLLLASTALEVIAHFLEDALPGPALPAFANTEDEAVNRALEFISLNAHRPLDVLTVARQAGLTRRTLERRFATSQRNSVAKEIEVARLDRARQMLAGGSMSVKEVGFAAGFAGPARLIRVFRSRFGITPGQYRSDVLRGA